MELWKPVVGNESRYEVSSNGIIRNKKTQKSVWYRITKFGYCYIRLYVDGGKSKNYMVHRIVMAAFVGPIPHKHDVDHVNGVKTDNRVENLEYVTRSENIRRSYAMGIRSVAGSKNPRATLTESEVLQIKSLLKKVKSKEIDITLRRIGGMFGVTRDTVKNINCGRTWANVN